MALSFQIDPRETGLLVVDMQNSFCHPQGSTARSTGTIAPTTAIIPKVQRLAQVCHEAGLPVLWVQQEHYPDDVTRRLHKIPTHLDKRRVGTGEQRAYPCLKGTWGAELLDELKAVMEPGDEIIKKHRSSAFYNTTLEVVLRMRGIKTLIICGVWTNYCVENTIRDAYARDYDIIVVEDCCACGYEDLHEATMKNVSIFYGIVVSLDELAEALKAIERTA